MSFLYFSANAQREQGIVQTLFGQSKSRLTSVDIFSALITHINKQFEAGQINLELIACIRLALRLNPYAGDIPQLAALYIKAKRAHAEAKFPAIFDIIRSCRENGLPVPVIVSCTRYLETALKLQQAMPAHYFNLKPLIIRGDVTINEEQYKDGVLTLPVDDTYEGLPLKMMEFYALFAALDDRCGIIKVDDDMQVTPGKPAIQAQLTNLFGTGDYIGINVNNALHDRLWHYGKCKQAAPFSYGKPLKNGWARGGMYYLSNNALQHIMRHYLRFPGILEGEVYEDKLVGDTLYDNNIHLVPAPLESFLPFSILDNDR